MKYTRIRHALLASAFVAGSSAVMAEESELSTSANATLATDYVFRGQSQTLEEAAVQAGVDATYGGFYVGAWGSNVDFDSDATAEIDFYGGYVFGLSEDIELDLGYMYYHYPGEDDDLDYQEVYAGVGWKDLGVGVAYSDEYLGDGGEKFWYVYADYSFSLPNEFGLDLHLAQNIGDDQDIAFEDVDGTGDIEDSYTEWSVGVSRTFKGLDFGLTYWDTTIDDDLNELGEGRVVFSIGASF